MRERDYFFRRHPPRERERSRGIRIEICSRVYHRALSVDVGPIKPRTKGLYVYEGIRVAGNSLARARIVRSDISVDPLLSEIISSQLTGGSPVGITLLDTLDDDPPLRPQIRTAARHEST